MAPNELGNIIGLHCAEATNFLFSKIGNSFTVTDLLKDELDRERKDIFGKLVPRIKQLGELSEEEAAACRQEAGITYANAVPELDVVAQELENALGEIEDMSDENFVMNLQSLYMVLSFIDPDELKEFAPHLLEHVGLA